MTLPADERRPRPLSFVIPNEAARLHALGAGVRAWLAGLSVDAAAIHAVDLVLEELGGNVLQHGYERGARGELRIEVATTPDAVLLVLQDDGRAFDPTRQPEPVPARSIAAAPIGGRGIAMVRRSVRALRYRRERGFNRIEVEVARALEAG